jgi:tetratricopeptide (TPR) repeat protein
LSLFRRTLLLAPNLAPAANNQGALLRGLGRRRDAFFCFLNAVRSDPSHVEARHNLANIQRDLGNYQAAIAAYRQVLALNPAHPSAWRHLGIAVQELSDNTAAESCHRRALTIRPDDAETHRQLSNLKHYQADDPHLTVLRALLSDARANLDDQARLHFALGKAHDDFGDLDTAFEHFRRGNAARKTSLGCRIDQHRALAARIRQAYTEAPPALAPSGKDLVRPIFVVGMPRSGTTLIEQILASHPQVHGAGELDDLSRLAFRHLPDGTNASYSRADLSAIREAYLAEASLLASGKPVLADKMPTNFLWIGVVRTAFPEARIVNLVRDPRAVAWSLYRHYFPARAHGYAYDLDDIAEFHALYRDLMNFWSELYPGSILDLHYETFVEEAETGTRGLLEYCGLSWNAQCLEFHRSGRPVKTASAGQVRQGIQRGSSDAWRRYQQQILTVLDGRDPLGFGDQPDAASSRS